MSKVLEFIGKYQDKSGGHCGCNIVQIMQHTGLSVGEARKELNKLTEDKKIRFRRGINHILFYKR